jgi:hypothetical protein
MLKKTENIECLEHICKRPGGIKAKIFLHDIHPYILIGKEIIDIKYCPFCGINPDTEIRP